MVGMEKPFRRITLDEVVKTRACAADPTRPLDRADEPLPPPPGTVGGIISSEPISPTARAENALEIGAWLRAARERATERIILEAEHEFGDILE